MCPHFYLPHVSFHNDNTTRGKKQRRPTPSSTGRTTRRTLPPPSPTSPVVRKKVIYLMSRERVTDRIIPHTTTFEKNQTQAPPPSRRPPPPPHQPPPRPPSLWSVPWSKGGWRMRRRHCGSGGRGWKTPCVCVFGVRCLVYVYVCVYSCVICDCVRADGKPHVRFCLVYVYI